MDFTIVLASRERPQLLANLVETIKDTTFDLNKIEIIVGIDDDDAVSHETSNCLATCYPFFKFFSQQRSKWLNKDYLNVGASKGTGKNIIAINDDCAFRTQNWDQIINKKLDEYLTGKPDGCVYGFISDALINRQGMGYSCFPLVSRKAFEALEFVMPPEFPSWSADIGLWQIFSSVIG